MERKTALIRGYEVDLLNFDEAVEYAVQKSENSSMQAITINPEMIEQGEKDKEFSKILKSADYVIPDGFGIQLALKINGINRERIPGIEFAKKLIEYCEKKDLPIALLGAKEEVINAAADNLLKEYPKLKIVFKRNGYFNKTEETEIVSKLQECSPKLVLVALGIPAQEVFINKYKNKFNNTVFIGVGGSFDVWSGKVKRAPLIFRKAGCEWLWRLIKEPSRFNRMFPTLPLFLFKVIMDKQTNK